VCAVTVTGLKIYEVTRGRPAPATTRRAPPKPEKTSNWQAIAAAGTRMGPPTAPVTITEFSDFQCPYCRRLAPVLKELRARYPSEVAVSYRHFPIPRHQHARIAAQASECAAAQGRFEAFHDALFAQVDSIGRLPWGRFARSAGVIDATRFDSCLADSTFKGRIEADIAAGNQLGVTGTPTVLVNQWRLVGAPTRQALDSLIRLELSRNR
jgi:protein-disulfide isomerase